MAKGPLVDQVCEALAKRHGSIECHASKIVANLGLSGICNPGELSKALRKLAKKGRVIRTDLDGDMVHLKLRRARN